MYRNRRLLDEAQEHSCQHCGSRHGVVAAHSNQQRHGKGMGIKAHDCFVAFLCWVCHHMIDQGAISKAMKFSIWESAHKRSIPLFQHLLNEEGRSLLAAAQ